MRATRRTSQEEAGESRYVAIAWPMPVQGGQSVGSLISGFDTRRNNKMIPRDWTCVLTS